MSLKLPKIRKKIILTRGLGKWTLAAKTQSELFQVGGTFQQTAHLNGEGSVTEFTGQAFSQDSLSLQHWASALCCMAPQTINYLEGFLIRTLFSFALNYGPAHQKKQGSFRKGRKPLKLR